VPTGISFIGRSVDNYDRWRGIRVEEANIGWIEMLVSISLPERGTKFAIRSNANESWRVL
jgi:hypothetical protein